MDFFNFVASSSSKCRSKSWYNTFSICVDPKSGNITSCPSALLKKKGGCKIPLDWTVGAPVSAKCLKYYPGRY